ncbi:MAG: putative conjugal transfer protein [Caulobacteraceae bacterium]|nr:MAG: putative conjugal transfer protein [Caulobacteraceae bacterium]
MKRLKLGFRVPLVSKAVVPAWPSRCMLGDMASPGRKLAVWAWLAAGLLACCLLLARFPAWVIYNGSPSVPVGFYIRDQRPLGLGAYVTLRAEDAAPAYAQLRDFTDRTDRFIKRVAATGGARICADGDRVILPGDGVVERVSRDTAGRELPTWQGCRTLGADEVFLVGDTADSFDSRYWGPVRRDVIEGVWRRLN